MADLSPPDTRVATAPAAAPEQKSPTQAALLRADQPATSPASLKTQIRTTAIDSVLETTKRWFVQEEAVVGLAHRAKNLPCQDAAQAVSHPHTALVLADGAGSSAVSEIGARAVVKSTIRLLDTLDKPLSECLDQDCAEPEQEARRWGLLLVKHAIGTLKDLAAEQRRELRDFRCTLLVAVIGHRRLLWLKVGDGAIVLEQRQLQSDEQGQSAWVHQLGTLGEQGKGEFANQTQFLDGVSPEEVQIGCLPTESVSGLALMSDGAAERLVANDGSRVATRVSALLAQLRQDKLRRSVLTRMFYEEDFCTGTSGDDRSIALAACENPEIRTLAPSHPVPAPTSAQMPALDAATQPQTKTKKLSPPAKAQASAKNQAASQSIKTTKPRRKRP